MIDFPASPADGQIFSATNGVVYKWSATYSSWLAQNPAPPIGGTGQFTANNTVAQNPAANTPSGVNFSTVIAGNAGLWYSTSTMRYTPPAGSYFISVTGHAGAPTGGNGTALLALYKNGAQIGQGASGSGSPSFSIPLSLGEYVDANGTDYFNAVVTCQAAGMNFTGDIFTAFPLTGMQGPTGPPGGGKLLQTISVETGAVATGTTTVPFDDTIPQQTEGDQYMSLAITPMSATSKLIIEVTANLSHTAGPTYMLGGLFQDSAPNALAVAFTAIPTTALACLMSFRHTMISGTTSPTTFKFRAGDATAGTTTFNGSASARLFGGSLASSIVITEVLP